MLCPEVWNFKAPELQLKTNKSDDVNNLIKNNNINNFFYNHLVSVLLPDQLKVSDKIINKLVNDCEYYKIFNFNLSDLIDLDFLASFVQSGKFSLLSTNTRIDCDNCVCVTPTGFLVLTIDKDTYYSLGIEGHPSHFTSKLKDRFIIKIDLKEDSLVPGKSKYSKLKSKLRTLGAFDVIILWEPPEKDICPSSVAKHFSDLGYALKVSFPKCFSNTNYSLGVPTLNLADADEQDLESFVEWLGMVSVRGDFNEGFDDSESYRSSYFTPEPNETIGQVKYLKWTGFFSPGKVQELLDELIEFNETAGKLWIFVHVQGFSDSPVAWNLDENHFYTNGDNGFFVLFNRENGVLQSFQCIKKKYKDKYG